ncbi:MAG: ChaN family lipoprotein [Gemmatimonadaceae bacterium]|nr:ChaN family lipoprotein [Gemmatimonadaceae bacterium]
MERPTDWLVLSFTTWQTMFRSATRATLITLTLTGAACARSIPPDLAPAPRAESRFYDSATGRDVTFDAMIRAASRSDVVFFGEQHDDPGTHRMELAVLAALGNGSRPIVLSLEMFERDVQGVLDDDRAGRIAESDFLSRARPWDRYTTDYRALVELARARGWPVIAANAPRRLASAVSRSGLAGIEGLPVSERPLAARDISCPRDAYYDKFAEQMQGHSAGGGPASATDSAAMRKMTDRFYEAQCVKDETMAESIVAALGAAGKGALVLHVDGAFHSDFGLGTVARVVRRRPGIATTVLSAVPVDAVDRATPAEFKDRGDFVILTRKPPAAPAAPASPRP